MRAALLLWSLLLLLWPLAGRADLEAFPGQQDLAAGLACHRNLDLDCARARLERALAAFSPERDPHYLTHVRTARWVLAQIHVAADDLGRAEQELFTLFGVDPDFALPPGDHPPKLKYVFKMARRRFEADVSSAKPPVDPPPVAPPPIETPPAPLVERYRLSAAARVVGLFGADAEAVMTGPGAGLRMAWTASDRLLLSVAYGWSRHPLVGRPGALQTMDLALGGGYALPLRAVELRLGVELGTLAMGIRDRYDHWGLVLAAHLGLAWPRSGPAALVIGLQPALLVSADGASFFLPGGVAGEFRW